MGRIKPTKEQLYKLYIIQKKGSPEIANIYGYNSAQAILNLIRKYEIPVRNNKEAQKYSTEIYVNSEWLINQYEIEDKSITEIATLINCSYNTAKRKLLELGIIPRKRYDKCVNNLPIMYGENNPAWKGGKFQRKDGYILIWDNTLKVYMLEHRKIMEEYLGRKLTIEEQIHHIDGCKWNNEIDNLQITDVYEHIKIHKKLGDL